MDNISIYIYDIICDVQDQYLSTVLRLWGKNEDGELVCVHVHGFRPWLYVEVDSQGARSEIGHTWLDDLCSKLPRAEQRTFDQKTCGKFSSLYDRTPRQMIKYNFLTNTDFRYFEIASRRTAGVKVHEWNVSPILQFKCETGINQIGWHSFSGYKRSLDRQDTLADIEYDCTMSNIKFCPDMNAVAAKLDIMSFDIECATHNINKFPDPTHPEDCIFQISCIDKKWNGCVARTLIYTGPELEITGGIRCKDETELLKVFMNHIQKTRPNFIIGYNILSFDLKYIIERSRLFKILSLLQKSGLHKTKKSEQVTLSWSSSAYQNQDFTFIPLEGIVLSDVLPLVRRQYRLPVYKLSFVAENFLKGDTKDPITPADIFEAWKSQDQAKLAEVGAYCIKDSQLTLDLFEKLCFMTSLMEMSSICSVKIIDLITRGQQIKVFNQIYNYCHNNNIVVDRNDSDESGYAGAYVVDPKPGIYEMAVSFDFNSLYPSIIIAMNICYSTLVNSKSDEEKEAAANNLNIFEWKDHIGCEHDVKIKRRDELKKLIAAGGSEAYISELRTERAALITYKPKYLICKKRRFCFRKAPLGIVPTIIQNLLQARKKVKQAMKSIPDSTSFEYMVLDGRQTALKLSANSIYGFFGTSAGILPLPEAAMTITHIGRNLIKDAGRLVATKYGGNVIYGDTDSVYANGFPCKDAQELWDYAKKVAMEISATYPAPLTIAFEDTIYSTFLLLGKKNYVYRTCTPSGVVKNDSLGSKGVLLVRRDSCDYTKIIYENLIKSIFNGASLEDCTKAITDHIVSLFAHQIGIKELIKTKSVRDYGEKVMGDHFGDYKIKRLPPSDVEKERVLQESGITGDNAETKYYISQLPPIIRLAHKLLERGVLVEPGSRLEFLVVHPHIKDNVGAKVEDVSFYLANKWWLKLDYFYYIETLLNPIDSLMEIVFKKVKYMSGIFKTCQLKQKLGEELLSICRTTKYERNGARRIRKQLADKLRKSGLLLANKKSVNQDRHVFELLPDFKCYF